MDLSSEYLKSIFGAFSITRTVVYHYFEGLPDQLPEDEMLSCFRELCLHFQMPEEGGNLLSDIFESLVDYRKDRDQEISSEQFQQKDDQCKEYVLWVFHHFDCFTQSEEGGFVYHSNR